MEFQLRVREHRVRIAELQQLHQAQREVVARARIDAGLATPVGQIPSGSDFIAHVQISEWKNGQMVGGSVILRRGDDPALDELGNQLELEIQETESTIRALIEQMCS